ncbi:MAG: RNA pseudouridine synthase [Lachnospiraceae bacterium]|jgi:23S rRNA pseudouridine1911/1915/1917 synthase|uniref:RluA family pseudouridine synthase n=1 Tax=Hominisplanchenecus murintestinalis TaxID=2941517 RepID=UPI000EA2E3AA|nr:RNA pseudouridine synthase [Hominisplanchenecus murintestinalis]MCI9515890.1 RNA pseudouridine synthase [Lachnospiraceae bacterium]RKJ95917.1 RNA pseudouridine synthase [Anaerotruncus sp. 1XD22-93]MCI9660555.1 RNA pseudouridine synthase [Lachnospiraceae bacterium]NBH97654.1 RNA pseudouridine synthase [Lachnospiraceae bacterium]NBI74710.1 RNA pseudouridine synthase [Lachnospiraceae bacterium]
MEIDILYEDGQLLVCRKPAGVPVQSGKVGQKDMVSILRNYRNGKEGDTYIGLVHRLDQPVQGVMVFAKTKMAAAGLSRQITDGRMKKQYLAVTCGKPMKKQGALVDYLLKDGRTNTSSIVPEGTKGAKRAELRYRIIAETPGYALAEIDLLTGRHHQIRVQMTGAGMPLAGDRKYNLSDAGQTEKYVALAAHRLSFEHPVLKKEICFEGKPEGAIFKKFESFPEKTDECKNLTE